MAHQIGVDFGTSHTVAVIGQTPLLFDSSPLLPSAVFADSDGRLLTGRDAHRSGHLDPGRWEPNPKRRIDDGALLLGAHEVPVRHVIAAVLARVGEEATRALGGPSGGAVLTYPAGWARVRRGVLADAATTAGFGAVRLVPEPVAAASYFTTVVGHRVPAGSAVVVYDFGAGTFDVSVLRRVPAGGWDVVATDGLSDVGGLDLDAAVVGSVGAGVDPAVWGRLTSPQGTVDQRHRRLLWEDARAVKEQLSREASATLVVPLADRDVILTRGEFEALARPWIERTVNLTTSTLFRSGVTADSVAGLFLVGGSSRIPLVATMLHRALGMAPVVLEQPELVVAKGSLAAADTPVGPVADPVGGPVAGPADEVAPVSAAPVSPGGAAPVSPVGPVPVSGVPVSAPPVAQSWPGVPSPVSAPPAPVSRAVGSSRVLPPVTQPQTPAPRGPEPTRPGRVGAAVTGGAAALALILMVASHTVRQGAFAGAATALRPATVPLFLAAVLLVAGARRTAPPRVLPALWSGGLAGAVAAIVFLALIAVVATSGGGFEEGSWVVVVAGVCAVIAGLVLLAVRAVPDPDVLGRPRWRAAVLLVAAGVVPGISAYTTLRWDWFGEHPVEDNYQASQFLSDPTDFDSVPPSGVLLGLLIGWAVAGAAAASAGRALGATAAPATRAVLYRVGAGVLAAGGGVLLYFMRQERTGGSQAQQAVTDLWADTVGDAHPGLVMTLLVGVIAVGVLLMRAQSQTRSGGS